MYKKISVALCIVICLCFIIPLIYLWWTMDPSLPPSSIKGPFISIYLRNLTDANQSSSSASSSILLYDIPNSDFVLDRSIWEWNNGSETSSRHPSKNSKSILLECHSNVPVKWEYKGDGGLVSEIRHHNKREIKAFDDNSTYWFTTSIELLKVNEQIAGKYLCSAIIEPTPPEESGGVFIHIFVKGFKTFMTNEEVRKEVEPEDEIVIPCPIADLDKSGAITLRELLQPLNTEVYHNVDPSIIREFDPRIGFKVEPNHFGSYLCVDQGSPETSGTVKIFKPRRLVVLGDYLTRSIIPLPKNDSALRLICEATENVTLNFINFLPFKRRQVLFYNDSSNFPHTSRIIMRNEWFTNFSTIECLTIKDNRVLRVWTYVKKESSDKTIFRFDPSRKGYECCTDPGIGVIPRLTQATCNTQTECEMKRSCVKLDKKCPLPSILNQPIYEGNPGCAVAKVENNPSGIVECSFGNLTKTYIYIYNRRTGFHNFTSSDFRKKNVPLNKMLRVSYETSIYKENTVTFTCAGPKLFFANGFQWAIKTRSGSPEYFINQSDFADQTSDETSESLHLPVEKVELKTTVICFAPLSYSYDWANATVKYRSNKLFVPSTTEYDDSPL